MQDDTIYIQSIINNYDMAIVPSGTFNIDAIVGLMLRSNMTLRIDGTLQAIPNDQQHYGILKASGVTNVKISGGIIRGERSQHTGHGGEWGDGIIVDGGSSNITIEGIRVDQCWGDGIYIDNASNVAVNNIISTMNRRQGMSVISVDGLTVTNGIFSNIGGTAPGDGIDLETDHGDQSIMNVLIERNQFSNTVGSNVGIGSPAGVYKNIIVRGNTHDGKSQPIWVSGSAGKLGEPLWATALSVFKGQSWYRWWGYPRSVVLP